MAENNKQKNFGQGDVKPDVRNMGRNQNQRDRKDHNNSRPQGGRNQNNDNQWQRKDYVKEKLEVMSGPTTNLQTKEGQQEKKFTGRCRLFVGNLPTSTTDEEFRKMFEKYGQLGEIFLNKQKGFGFVNLDTRQNAENARSGLDFSMKDGRQLRVRFASHAAALKIKNLSPWVSNELLENAFSVFGDVERAVVIVDDRGRPVGEGIIEYARKQSAQLALKRCNEGCYLLTSSPRPVVVEPMEHRDEEDGLPEKNFQKGNKQYLKEREAGPRLAEPGTFEYEFANRWKKLYDLEQQKREYLEKEIEEGRRALDDQMEFAIYDHEANLLRERLRHMEEQSTLIQRERELRREDEIRRDEARRQQDMLLRQQQEEILRNDLRRRQEESMMMQGGYGDMMERDAMRKLPPGGLSPSISADPSSGIGYGNGMIPGDGMGHPPVIATPEHDILYEQELVLTRLISEKGTSRKRQKKNEKILEDSDEEMKEEYKPSKSRSRIKTQDAETDIKNIMNMFEISEEEARIALEKYLTVETVVISLTSAIYDVEPDKEQDTRYSKNTNFQKSPKYTAQNMVDTCKA